MNSKIDSIMKKKIINNITIDETVLSTNHYEKLLNNTKIYEND